MKLNKSVHFNLLCVVAIVFVCVYLYYTISDVKKIAGEVRKHTDEITVLAKELGELKKKAATCTVGGACAKPTVDLNKLMVEAVAAASGAVEVEESIGNTEDMKKFLADAAEASEAAALDAESANEAAAEGVTDVTVVEAEGEAEGAQKNFAQMSSDELKKQKYEDLREYCRSNGMNAKGTKDVLVARILA